MSKLPDKLPDAFLPVRQTNWTPLVAIVGLLSLSAIAMMVLTVIVIVSLAVLGVAVCAVALAVIWKGTQK